MILLLVACAGETVMPPVPASSLEFLTPREGDEVPAGVVDVSVLVEDFVVVAPKKNRGTPVGFLVVSVDDERALVAEDTVFDLLLETPGDTTLSAELIYADGAPLDPPVSAAVTITVVE